MCNMLIIMCCISQLTPLTPTAKPWRGEKRVGRLKKESPLFVKRQATPVSSITRAYNFEWVFFIVKKNQKAFYEKYETHAHRVFSFQTKKYLLWKSTLLSSPNCSLVFNCRRSWHMMPCLLIRIRRHHWRCRGLLHYYLATLKSMQHTINSDKNETSFVMGKSNWTSSLGELLKRVRVS